MNLVKQSRPIEGISNLRDLGGYKTKDGTTVRLGRIYRSNHLANLSKADVERLGLRGTVDCGA